MEGARPRGRPMETWREVVEEDCHSQQLNKEDTTYRNKWSKLIEHIR